MNIFMGNAIWQLIAQSDFISKLVLIALLGLSIVCWTVFFYKLILLRTKKRQLKDALAQAKGAQTLDDLLALASKQAGTFPGYFVSRNLVNLKSILETNKSLEKTSFDTREYDMVQQHSFFVVDEMVVQEEAYLPILSTCAAVAPLLGLFGTVWGLIHSFIRISEKQTADIATVAPGIAEALITTLAGLVVAIPALMMFSYLNVQLRAVEQGLVTLAEKFGSVAKHIFRKTDKNSFVAQQAPRGDDVAASL